MSKLSDTILDTEPTSIPLANLLSNPVVVTTEFTGISLLSLIPSIIK